MARLVLWTGVVLSLAVGPVLAAPPQPKPAAEATASSKAPAGDGTYEAARERDEARQRQWDRKMKALTGSICTGC